MRAKEQPYSIGCFSIIVLCWMVLCSALTIMGTVKCSNEFNKDMLQSAGCCFSRIYCAADAPPQVGNLASSCMSSNAIKKFVTEAWYIVRLPHEPVILY